MKLSIGEAAKLSHVSVRTLHYYDEIGLLKPVEINDSGYRFYDEKALETLQIILFYRELEFSLKDISKIMSQPYYDKKESLIKQKELLRLKRERLDKLIALIDDTIKGDNDMSFKQFDNSEFENLRDKYAEEAERLYGKTDAYKESAAKTKKYSKDDWNNINSEANHIMSEFYSKKDEDVDSEEVHLLVEKWRKHITKYYYNCTKEILQGLGLMYVADERFKENIDKHGEGTAEFMSKAIESYCRR